MDEVPVERKEKLHAVALPMPLYDRLRDEAHEKRVTMVSILTEVLNARYGVSA